jgi:hypothetical protein
MDRAARYRQWHDGFGRVGYMESTELSENKRQSVASEQPSMGALLCWLWCSRQLVGSASCCSYGTLMKRHPCLGTPNLYWLFVRRESECVCLPVALAGSFH